MSITGGSLGAASWSVLLGVSVGLIIGKPVGVFLAGWLSLRLRIGTLPPTLSLRHLVLLGVVAGVGFTMALFIAQLAFTDAGLFSAAKLGVLTASGGAAILGMVCGRLLLTPRSADETATAGDAVRSTRP